ncbi:hypothetical protein LLG96_04475 [bacterium]|nr:hypothetical protein [bacterium]
MKNVLWKISNSVYSMCKMTVNGLNQKYINEDECIITKMKMLQAVQELPDDASVEDAMERFLMLAKIERGIAQADHGETVPHQAVRDRMAEWLK